MHKLHCFLLLSNLFCYFHYRKLFIRKSFTKSFMLNPDPQKMKADPDPLSCPEVSCSSPQLILHSRSQLATLISNCRGQCGNLPLLVKNFLVGEMHHRTAASGPDSYLTSSATLAVRMMADGLIETRQWNNPTQNQLFTANCV